jgi:hypothetical protein
VLADLKNLEEYIYSELNVQQLTLSEDESPYNVKVREQLYSLRTCLTMAIYAVERTS